MSANLYALEPEEFLRAIDATRATLGKARMELFDIVDRVRELTDDAPYAVIGGLAQILWARKTHTDDLDVALASRDLTKAHDRVRGPAGAAGWALPEPPDRVHEADDVFEVYHLLYRGSVVDLISFENEAFTREVIQSARPAPELGGIRFVRPELLMVTHLLRPTVEAKLAAVEFLIARRAKTDFDTSYARSWAARVDAEPAFERISRLAEQISAAWPHARGRRASRNRRGPRARRGCGRGR